MKHKNSFVTLGIMTSMSIIPGVVLNSSIVSADVVDKVSITVPMSCTLEGTGMNTHNAEINNGQYNSNIGETTLKAFCNDTDGFAIYAIGYTDNLNGKNVLTSSELGSTHDITTGTAISGNTSNWAMKLSTISSPVPTYPISIENSFDSFHNVPNTHTLVAKRTSGTDIGQAAEGSTLKTTYQAYISSTQSAGTYTGQVKYTLVHPNDLPTPPDSMLDTGQTVGAKMKSLAAGTEKSHNATTSDIKAIHMANSLPANFEPSEANTVSTPDSKYPIYIFFDNTNDAGIMNFYTENDTVVMNQDSSFLFMSHSALEDISGLADWDASNAVNLNMLFAYDTSLSSLYGLENWDIRNVTNMQATFAGTTTLNDISALSDWDLKNVITINLAFFGAESLTSLEALENWNTSNVLYMPSAFRDTMSLTSYEGLEKWDTSQVKDMNGMFGISNSTGRNDKTAFDLTPLKDWDVSKVTSMSSMFQNNNLASFVPLKNWNVSNVRDFGGTFNQTYTSTITTLEGLEDWDVSSAIDVNWMFADTPSLVDVSAINDWDIRNVQYTPGSTTYEEGNYFEKMFRGASVHPEFTMRAGTWNSEGSFIPSE